MRTFLTLAASVVLLAAIGATSSQAGEYYYKPDCGCVPTTITTTTTTLNYNSHPSTPFPSRNGIYIGHFDANGVPQSISEQSGTYETTSTTTTVIPCEESEGESQPSFSSRSSGPQFTFFSEPPKKKGKKSDDGDFFQGLANLFDNGSSNHRGRGRH